MGDFCFSFPVINQEKKKEEKKNKYLRWIVRHLCGTEYVYIKNQKKARSI